MDPVSVNMMRISTRDLPELNRIATICELYGRTILKHDIEPIGDQPFEFEASLYSLPGLGLASTVIGPCRAPRGPHHIDSDDLVFSVMLSGGRVCTATRARSGGRGRSRHPDRHRGPRRCHD